MSLQQRQLDPKICALLTANAGLADCSDQTLLEVYQSNPECATIKMREPKYAHVYNFVKSHYKSIVIYTPIY